MSVRREDFLEYNFFMYGTPYTGECKGMRYRISRSPLENVVFNHDPHKNDEALFEVIIWRGPFNFDTTKEEKETITFPFTEEGLENVIKWLEDKYNEKKAFWEDGMSLFPKRRG